MNWTKEQQKAIYTYGSNILVSSGAGSGKTAVLTERVINNLTKGIKINEMLILTFTNNAAAVMKSRIRKKILKNPSLKDNLDYLDSAYITTFDSYMLSLVKKYHYLINVSRNLTVIDSNIIQIIKEDILNEIFEEYYQENNKLFINFINDFTIKDDEDIKKSLLKIISKLDLLSNKENYLNNYLDSYFNKNKIDSYITEFNNLLIEKIKDIKDNLFLISKTDYYDYYLNLNNCLNKLLNSNSYEDILINKNIKLPKRPLNSNEIREYCDNIKDILKELNELVKYSSINEIYSIFETIKDYLIIIIEIIQKFYLRLNNYKNKDDLYEFNDIEIMGLKILKENEDIRKEIKNYFKEICVDEYQDTNDLQEEFINLIENNNVYMVGDLKQSIYRFRNANPYIFKNKYDNYSHNKDGIKIDLLKNFRSRKEVIKGINDIFKYIMDDKIGNVNYQKNHMLEYGNLIYDQEKCYNQNYNLEILNYNLNDKEYTKDEVEAFIIGKDIINKINNGYQVVEENKLRKSKYSDYTIIMDRNSSFLTYKKVFEYLSIPLSIIEEKKLTNEIDIIIIKNIILLILKIKDRKEDIEFKYCMISILRSFLFKENDNEIFKLFINKNFKNNILYQKCLNIIPYLDKLDNYELLELILQEFNYYEKLVTKNNIEEAIIRIDNLLEIAKNINKLGYTINDFQEYLTKMIESKNEITYKLNNDTLNNVKLMNIHQSKGLEFPICYYSGYYKLFNKEDIKDKIVYDNKYGIITSYFKDGLNDFMLKDLLKNKYLEEDISEKLRLMYVALTRSKEKIIIVANLDDKENNVDEIVPLSIRKKYDSFLSIINSINNNLKEYVINIDLNKLNLTKNYLIKKDIKELKNIDNKQIIEFKKINIPNELVLKKKASKEINKLITLEERKLMEKGTYIHKILEVTDFLNIKNDNPFKDMITNLVKELKIDKNTLIYKEHEFIIDIDNVTYHGIIDLVLVFDNVIKIVDYKLKNIDDLKYIEQLKIYKMYISKYFKTDIECYLYSIYNRKLKKEVI